jgi:SHS2 domain-containing protein
MWRFVEDVSVADIAFEATAPTLDQLLQDSAAAVAATMVKDPATVLAKEERRMSLEARDPERLLHKFLQELVYYKDAELLLLTHFEVKVAQEPGKWRAEVVAKGEKLDPARHEQVVDVKAVTWHRFRVTRGALGWEAMVVLDI